ncbi:MAG: hypothetical protein AVDCRST_MAG87-2003 [uncultured Thermomicrobiales bacterium]|uniref:Uncharacterized protein n=1 Tax=uncultured Thermomicrobiales bacterium TaxID=1645740 RepID=A0A6J4V2E3_9BACT|nr:MAG: hypothetical protein AVDCRST_MAG87-2003 [uncultured Thermomicrobiales bacterium]
MYAVDITHGALYVDDGCSACCNYVVSGDEHMERDQLNETRNICPAIAADRSPLVAGNAA